MPFMNDGISIFMDSLNSLPVNDKLKHATVAWQNKIIAAPSWSVTIKLERGTEQILTPCYNLPRIRN